MNLFNFIGSIINGSASEINKKLTSRQIWELNRMNYSAQESVKLSLYNSTNDVNVSFLKWRESINENESRQQRNKIIGNCQWCGTGYFKDDRNCVSCGGEIKRFEEVKNKVVERCHEEPENINKKKFMCSTATVYALNENEELIFKGITLLDSSIEIKIHRSSTGYIYYHSQPASIQICDIIFEKKNGIFPKITKLILETQIASVDSGGSIIRTLQYIIPKARLDSIYNETAISATPLSVRDRNSDNDYYGYCCF